MIGMSSNQAFAEEILATLIKRGVRYQGNPTTVSVEPTGWIEVTFLSMATKKPTQKRIRINVTPIVERDNFDAVHAATDPQIVVSEIERAIDDIKVRTLLTPKSAALQALH
jgi:hypothetical protein